MVIGTASGQVFAEDTPRGSRWALEVNHGPEGAPVAGDCWVGHTPDIRPGDRVRVTGPSGTDTVIVDDLALPGTTARAPQRRHRRPVQGLPGQRAGDPPSFIDSAEFRAEANNSVRFEGRRAVRVERRPGAKPGQLWQRYPSPFRPARNDDENPFNQAELRRALLRDGHATGFGHVAVLPREAMLVDGLVDTPGPAIGCSGASAQWEVGSVSPKRITRANRTRLVQGHRAHVRRHRASCQAGRQGRGRTHPRRGEAGHGQRQPLERVLQAWSAQGPGRSLPRRQPAHPERARPRRIGGPGQVCGPESRMS